MKRLFLIVSFFLMLTNVNAQKASEYLCLDSTVTLQYESHYGALYTLRFVKSFVYEQDTICYYEKRFEGDKDSTLIFFAYNGSTLVIGGHLILNKFNGIDRMDRRVQIVNSGEEVDSTYIISFDMDISNFKSTTRLIKKYKDENGNKYKNVIEFDQHNLTDDFHYITLIAPGIGIIAQGKKEMTFIRIVKE